MKNLSTSLSFSLCGAITFFITIAVCLAGFAGAEIMPGYRTNDHSQGVGEEMVEEDHSPGQEKIVNSRQQSSNSRGDDDELSEQPNFANYFRNLQGEGNFGRQMKRHSENLRKELAAETEAENDGYVYDDDDYYHFDIKRDGDQGGRTNEALESEKKDSLVNNKHGNLNNKVKNDKEEETIELLNFSQTHMKNGASDPSQNILKNFQDKGTQSYSQSDSIKMNDLKENSGISEKAKDTKEESGAPVNTDQKLVQPKKEDASTQEKDTAKLKESKVENDSEKKESDAGVKGNSDSLTSKNIKENAKNTDNNKAKVEGDAKPAKLKSDINVGACDTSEKSNLKDSESAKLVKDEKDNPKLVKLNSEDASKSEISQNENKAALVSSDFKESGKLSGLEEEDKESEETSDKNMGLRYYRGGMKLRKEADEMAKNFEVINEKQRNLEGISRSKGRDVFSFPIAFEIKNENAKESSYKGQDQVKGQEMQRVDQPVKTSFRFNFPPSDLENTEYHKNFIKSLRRYKGLEESTKPAKDNYSPLLMRSYYYPSLTARGNQPFLKKSKIKKRKSKKECSAGSEIYNAAEVKKKSRSTEAVPAQGTSKQEPENKSSLITKKNVKKENNNRRRRKSPQKFEYKIKIINEPTAKSLGSSSSNRKRKKKETKSKIIEKKSGKKSSYSQVLLDDLTKLRDQKNDRSLKRRGSVWFGDGQFKSSDEGEQGIFRLKGMPSGYYTNRVKFGNKHFLRNEETQVASRIFRNADRLHENNSPMKATQGSFQCSWGTPILQENSKHVPQKRFSGNNIFSSGRGNSLLLIKKGRNGERITKTFTDETKDDAQKSPESEELARILSQDSDYIVLKKTDNNRYQKISLDNIKDEYSSAREFRSLARPDKRSFLSASVHDSTNSGRKTLTRLHRSSDQKTHNPNTISTSLKKTFEKFKDLADFFKDSEQETQENQQQTQELKESSDIVFSEDKLPDPLVINNEVEEKNPKLKSQNSITSISTNFKQLDQDKKDSCKDIFMDSKETAALKPALKNAFPEAKSISSVMKDGKEIILIDLNKNELMMNHKGHNVLGGSCGSSERVSKPLIIPGNRQVEIIWNPNPTFSDQAGTKNVLDKKYPLDKTFDRANKFPDQETKAAYSGQPLVTMPLNDLAQLSILLKQLNEKKESISDGHNKIIKKKSAPTTPNIKTSSNIAQFLEDYRKLSEINNEQLPKKISVAKKRHSNYLFRPYPELSYSDSNEKDVRDFLESAGAKENKRSGAENEESRQSFKGWESEDRRSDIPFSNSETYDSNVSPRRQGQWSSAKENRDYSPFKSTWNEYSPNYLKSNLGNILQIDEKQDNANEKDYQDELLEELSEASNKIERLRREGADDQSLRKTMENALPFKAAAAAAAAAKSESNEKEKAPAMSESKLTSEDVKNSNANLNERDSKEKGSGAAPSSAGNEELTSNTKKESGKDLQEESHVKEIHENKPEPLQKNDDKNQLKESVESKNSDNFELSELVGGEGEEEGGARDRRENERNPIRRKRSSEAKVSTTEVENTILSNFTEDNYQSVYSPGIKRKLLSIDDGEDDGDFKAERNGENVSEPICVKNVAPDCSDHALTNCLHEQEAENDTNRTKRSLMDNYHSNHKREIDLDESMPNDFQNFLETSLGLDSHVPSIGGQKRDTLKKKEARRQNKETVRDQNDISVADVPSAGKDKEKDSPLEKREVSEAGDRKQKNYKKRTPNFEYDTKMGKITSPAAKTANSLGRVKDKPDIKVAPIESESEKFPTRIRIQITKDTTKDNNKSEQKKILDENDITSNEMENPSNEKEFSQKRKFYSKSDGENLYSTSILKNPYSSDYGYDEPDTESGKQKYYMMAHPPLRKKKKRKFIQENVHISSPDVQISQKMKESLIRKYMSDRNLYEATTQRVPVSNHLPQVETVYNPTQGANKAQVEECGLTLKDNKDVNSKNSLEHQDDTSVINDKVFKFYINSNQDTQVKNIKDEPKDLESLDWKPYSRKMKLRQDSDQSSAQIPSYKGLGVESSYSGLNAGSMSRKSISQVKQSQKPYSSYLSISPADVVMSSESVKPDIMWNALTKSATNSKLWKDRSNNYDVQNAKDSPSYNGGKFDDTSWKEYNNYYMSKNPKTYKFRNYISSSVMNALSDKSLNAQKYYKSLQDNTANGGDLSDTVDNLKDSDYLDSIEDPYGDSDDVKQDSEMEADDHGKKESKLFAGYKAVDEENTSIGNGGEELEEDYEGNNEEDSDDYSLSLEKSENAHVQQENDKNLNSYRSIEPLYSSSHRHKANKLQQSRSGLNRGGLRTTKKDDKLNMNSASASYADTTKEEDSPLNSMNVLKMANENSNVLGKNLMKNLQQYNYDSNLRNEDIFSNENNYFRGFKYPSLREKEKLDLKNVNWPSKLKRSHGPSKVGDRYFYAAKTETFDLKDFEPKKYASFKKNVRCGHYQLPKSNPLSAELRDMENEYEYESEDNNKYFGENLLDSGKGNLAKQGRQFKSGESGAYFKDNEKIKRKSPEKTDTAKENLRDNDENISEDGVLENVIGKYIMRKSVKVNEDKKVRNNGFEPVGIDKKKLESSSDELNRHKPQKRSVVNAPYFVNTKNNRGKRFSAGHLTENNYRKFHKKNSRKRRLTEKDSINFSERKTFNDRSRFDRSVFRKLSKEKETKKLDFPDSKTAGFEPILWDSRGDNARNAKQEAASKFEKLYTWYNANRQSLDEKLKFDEGDKENSRNGEKSLKSQVQGPWKIRLNEKNAKVSEQGSRQSKIRFGQSPVKRENTGEEKEEEALSPNAIEAYLLIRDNVGAAESDKTSQEDDLSPTSGAEADKEVGNSYRVFHEGGEETPRKRSGRSSSPKDRPLASAAEAAENSISLEKISKNLEKGKNLFEGDSKARAPFDDKKNANFVNVQGQRLRFDDKNKILSNGRLRKSVVLPLFTDANIIGDSRHINEETSKNLGQQIVDAILTHVSTNPRFKQVIAPGLSGKSPSYRQTIKTGKTSTKIKYPDQVQSFLQTIMRHMEKMAENDVKKRMCNKIDRQSKDFLRSMLEFPEISEPRSCKQQKGFFVDPPCPDMCQKAVIPPKVPPVDVMSTTPYSSLPPMPMPPPFPIGSNCGPALKASICEALKKKKEVLKKLIEDYQRLSELEREAINISFQFLVAQLEDTEQLLEFLNGCGECYHPPDCPPTEIPSSTEHPCCPNQEGPANLPYMTSQPGAPILPNNPNIPQLTQKNISHVFHFEPVDGCPIHNVTTEAETPHPQTTTLNPCCANENSDGGFEKVTSSNEPQSFDLLPNHPNITNPKPPEGGIRSRNIAKTESARVKEPSPKGQQSAVNIQKMPTSVSEVVASPKQNELHKLGIGDAAGLQMAHSSRSPWVSNLDVAKQSKLVNQNAFAKPGNSGSTNAVKNYRSSGKGDSDSAGKDSKNTKVGISKDRLGLSGSGETKTNSRLDSPKRQYSINRLADGSSLEVENSGAVKNIRKKRRTMRYNVRKKNKRNIIDNKLFKLVKKKKVTSEYEEDPEMEYLIWASMPAVRRRLNDLEQGIEVDKNSAQLLLGNMGSERAEKDEKENSDRIKLLGLRK